LFPETYFFPWGASKEAVLKEMVELFDSSTKELWNDTLTQLYAGLTQDEIIIMASIIEAETGLGSELKKVSSVYHNRLRKNMKLDADPTVIYGLGGLDRDLMKRDLRKDTKYNTYMHKDLPPTPINSPGLEAIKGAMNPMVTDYLYFVAENNGGGHYFSKTHSEHINAVRRVRAERRSN
jgi:UPF0755 protein